MSTEPITRELVESVAYDAVAVAVSDLAARLSPPRSVVVSPSDVCTFGSVVVGTGGVPLVLSDVDRLRVTLRNRDAATSVFLHSQGQPDAATWGVEVVAGATVTLATRDAVWATSAAGTVNVDLVIEAVRP